MQALSSIIYTRNGPVTSAEYPSPALVQLASSTMTEWFWHYSPQKRGQLRGGTPSNPVQRTTASTLCIEPLPTGTSVKGNRREGVLVSVPGPKPTPAQIAFISRALYWKWYTCRMRSGDETKGVFVALVSHIGMRSGMRLRGYLWPLSATLGWGLGWD